MFVEYGAWLCEDRSIKVAALRLDKDASFFAELANLGPELPTAEAILEHFPPSRLVRHRLAMRFLAVRRNVHLDANAKSAATERRRIQTIVGALPAASSGAMLLSNYRDHLFGALDAGHLSLRSVRLYLRVALGSLQSAIACGVDRPNAASLKRYLRGRHGQRASLYPFLRFLDVEMPSDPRSAKTTARASRSRVRAALLACLQKKPNGPPDEQTMVLALSWFHNLSLADAREIVRKGCTTAADKWIVLRDDEVAYYLPGRLGEDLNRPAPVPTSLST